MRKRQSILSLFTVIVLLISIFVSKPAPIMASTTPSVDFSVVPSPSELTLDPDGVAEGNLNINIVPKGMIAKNDREPIDVVFVHDTSGSMKDYFSSAKKSVSAKNALTSALNYFKSTKKTGDKFYLVPFNSNVRTSGSVKVVEGLPNIENVVKYIGRDEYNIDGTNYTQTLEYAKNLLQKSSNKNKYIIFLTDGEPTVLNHGGHEYVIYTNGTAKYKGSTSSRNLGKTRELIHRTALETSDSLSQSNITMYSIAFAPQGQIDFRLLQSMSEKTGGSAVLATPQDLESIFQSISKKIDNYSINGEVTVDLSKYAGKIVVNPTANVTIGSNDIVRIPFKFNYPVGKQADPSKISVSLPLIFKKADTYTLDNIKLQYDGLSSPIVHDPVTFKVSIDPNSMPGATFSVKPGADEFIKPPTENAKGNIDITVTPKGMAPKDERLPIDVVFVHDTSGSMAESFDGAKKDTTAKSALKSAIEYFELNEKSGDNFYFIPFDSDVSYKSICGFLCFNVKPTMGLVGIKNLIPYLDNFLISRGNTNYTAALTEASQKFIAGRNSNKYIVFLTDGEPTSSKQEALNISTELGKKGVTIYSIGFAAEGDVDFELLRNMSLNTGGYAVQGRTGNLSTIFNDISKKVNSSTISGSVSIDLKEFNGDVIVDPASNFQANSQQVVQIPFKITFPVGQRPDPSLIQHSLPLQFKKKGSYEFSNNIQLSYTDNKGNSQSVTHPTFTVEVKDESAPYFLSEVQIHGNQHYSADNLVKISEVDTERNEFTVEYKLFPETVFTSVTKGTINQLKIHQPLFDGISLANHNQIELLKDGEPIPGATVNLVNNGRNVEINLGSNAITYESGKFSIEDYTIKLKLKADWALPYTMLPQAQLSFTDSRFKEQMQSLNLSEQRISMNVHLEGNDSVYTGDYTGTLTKVNRSDGQILADAQLSNEIGVIQKPVMSMKLLNNISAIQVTYFDNTMAILYLKTDYTLQNLSLGEDLKDGAETKGRVGFKINKFVLGDNVVYEYQVKTKDNETEWAAFDPSAQIELPSTLEGLVEIRVRTNGGFSLNNTPIVKTLTILKESIVVNPNPIELEVGQSIDVDIKIVPEDNTTRDFEVEITNPDIATYENGVIKGIKAGETTLIVTTVDIAGNTIREEIRVQVKSILVTAINVTPNPVNMNKHDEFDKFTIVIEPKNATVNIEDLIWESLSPTTVSIVRPGVIYGRATGLGEIIIKANDGSNVEARVVVNVGSPLIGIKVPDEITIEKGASDKNINDYITYIPENPTNIDDDYPKFEPKNSMILEVEPNGEIIPKRVGSTIIQVTVMDDEGKKFIAEVKVNVIERKPGENIKEDKY